MRLSRGFVFLIPVLGLLLAGAAQAQSTRIYNTVKTKLANGEQVVGGTVTSSDPAVRYTRFPPDDTYFIRLGVRNSLQAAPAGVAPTEGAED